MRRLLRTSPVLLVLSLGLAGCGGDDAPSREDFAQDAERICRQAEETLADIGQDASSPDEIADAVDTVIEETRSSVDELKELDLPDGDDGEAAERFVDALESDTVDKGVPALEDLRDALEDGDQRAAQKAAERLRQLEDSESNRFARELGATDCVE